MKGYVELRVPPSVNKMWRVGAGNRIRISRHYRAWRQEASLLLQIQKDLSPVSGKAVSVAIAANINHTRDLDNIIKPTIDALVHAEMIPDDRWVNHIEVRRSDAAGSIPKTFMRVCWGIIFPFDGWR